MNTANLQLEGLVMAVASISEALVQKGLLSHRDLAAALEAAEKRLEEDSGRELSDANRAAAFFPVRVLLLANEASESGRKLTFTDYAGLVGKLT